MTSLYVPFGDFDLPMAQGTRRVAHPMPIAHSHAAAELGMRVRSIEELQRRLAQERKALLHLVNCFAPVQTVQMHLIAAKAHNEVAASIDRKSGPQRRDLATAINDHVVEAKQRLEAVGGIRKSTRRAYASALRGVDAWLRDQSGSHSLDDAALAEYLAVLATEGRSVSAAVQVVAAVRWRAKLEGLALPATKTARALRCYRRAAGAGTGQVRGISWEEADRMCDLAGRRADARGLRDATLIAMASDALLRVSEVSAVHVEDVTFEDDGSARLLVPRSKTDQCGRGTLLFLGPRTARLTREWTEAAGITAGALFRAIHRSGAVAAQGIGPSSVRRVIIDGARAAGIRGRVSGHSLRVGSAQSLAKHGAGLVAMQKAGRWASPDMPARYTRSQAAADGAVACFRYPPHPEKKSKNCLTVQKTGE